MAIQLRRGAKADYDASRMLPGEAAVFLDTEEMVFKGNTNSVRLLGNNAQSFDTSEQAQIRANISAGSAADFESIIQESAFEIVDDSGELKLYWYGAAGECPYTIAYESGVYNLYFSYTA